MAKEKYITEDDLYKYSEKEIVDKIKNCPNSEINNAFNIFSNRSKTDSFDSSLTNLLLIYKHSLAHINNLYYY